MLQIEVDKPPECCKTCRFWVWDIWYQTEHICDCERSQEFSEPKGEEDSCDWWEDADD